MPAYTPVLGLYKPGGGSTGLITPDEPVDIDKINSNFDLIDGAIGVGAWSTAGRPSSPFTGKTGYNSTLDTLERWNGTAWSSALPSYLQQGTISGGTTAQRGSAILWAGRQWFDTSLGVQLIYTGSAWQVVNTPTTLTSALRAALPTALLVDGYRVLESDTGLSYVWSVRAGNTWLLAAGVGHAFAGWQKIIPSAVGGGSIDTNGDAIGSTTSGLRLDGVIDWTRFSRYRILVTGNNASVSGTSLYLFASFGGVVETGTTYWSWLAHRNIAGTGSDLISSGTNSGAISPPFSATNQTFSSEVVLQKFNTTSRMSGEVTAGISAQGSSAMHTGHLDYGTTKDWTTMDGLQVQPGSGTIANLRAVVYALE